MIISKIDFYEYLSYPLNQYLNNLCYKNSKGRKDFYKGNKKKGKIREFQIQLFGWNILNINLKFCLHMITSKNDVYEYLFLSSKSIFKYFFFTNILKRRKILQMQYKERKIIIKKKVATGWLVPRWRKLKRKIKIFYRNESSTLTYWLFIPWFPWVI